MTGFAINAMGGWVSADSPHAVPEGYTWSEVRPEQEGRSVLEVIAERRYEAETSGVIFNGMKLDTSRDSQGLIAGAAVAALIDDNYSLAWKVPTAPGGRVTLTAVEVLAIASVVRAHVQACFNREFALNDAVADGSFSSAMLDEGWPV